MNDLPRHPSSTPTNITEIIYAGGTISAIATADGYREGGHVIDLVAELARLMPDFKDRFNVGHPAVAFTGLSEDIEPKHWLAIEKAVSEALSRKPQAIIITHGTDSMAQTAQFLRGKFLKILKKSGTKILLTGANDETLHPKTDAWDNLVFTFESASNDVTPDVYIAFAHRLIRGDKAVKEPYSGRNMAYTSISDPNYKASLSRMENHAKWLRNRIIKTFPDVSADTKRVISYDANFVRDDHRALLEHIETHPTAAIIFNLYHSGTANAENPHMSLAKLVRKLRVEKKIVSFAVTENNTPVDLTRYKSSSQLRLAGTVPLYDMPRIVAIAKLECLVGAKMPAVQLIQEMLKPRVDEIDKNLIRSDDIRKLLKLYKG